MKKGLFIRALGNDGWIGGVYYAKNIAYVILSSSYITENYNIYVYTNSENKHIFDGLPSIVKVVSSRCKSHYFELLHRLLFLLTHNVKIVYPSSNTKFKFGIRPIAWIPDLQHNLMPEMYEDKGKSRINETRALSLSELPIVFSSNSSLNDFKRFYGKNREKVYVVPFVSNIINDINEIDENYEMQVLSKYRLDGIKYVYIANQFWKHKNHIVVLKAIEIILSEADRNCVTFVFTGKMKDERNPEYIDELKILFDKLKESGRALNLGFISRKEQLVIMKNADFLIQPSLFEGWGTVLEDAKVLDKTVLLSDIPVHREQMNDKCILFDPYDSVSLSKLIEVECQKDHVDNIKLGIEDTHRRAIEYSKGFEKLLLDLER